MKPYRSRKPCAFQLEALEDRKLLVASFAQQAYIASAVTGSATITLKDFPLIEGQVTTVELITSDGTAKAGVDYLPVDQLVTFPPEGFLPSDQTTEIVTIPLINHNATGLDQTIHLTLKAVNSPIPESDQTALVYVSPNANVTAPTVQNVRLLTRGNAVTGIVLTYNTAMDPVTAGNVHNYYLFKAQDRIINDLNGPRIALKSAVYNPVTHTVTLKPARPLPDGTLYVLTLNPLDATFGEITSPITDAQGVPIAGLTDGDPVGLYSTSFERGATIRIHENFSAGRIVVPDTIGLLKLTGGGTMELISSSTDTATTLRIIGANKHSILSGKVTGYKIGLPFLTLDLDSPRPIRIALDPEEFPIGFVS
jgi:Calx-beta domain